MRRFVTLSALALAIAGCRAMTRSGPAAQAPETILEVDNRGFADMNIYVVEGSQRIRIGFATGNGRTKLTIPARLVSGSRDLQFLADPVGSNRTAVSDKIYVTPGDRVTLMIPPGA